MSIFGWREDCTQLMTERSALPASKKVHSVFVFENRTRRSTTASSVPGHFQAPEDDDAEDRRSRGRTASTTDSNVVTSTTSTTSTTAAARRRSDSTVRMVALCR
jgi:hypothetical protein